MSQMTLPPPPSTNTYKGELVVPTWRPIPGFPGYDASTDGLLRRTALGARGQPPRVFSGWINPCGPNGGYRRTSLRRGGRTTTRYVHHLVCLAFHGQPPGERGTGLDQYQVNHKDGDKLNNHPDNLEWVTRAENNAHASATGLYRRGRRVPGAKITPADALEIRRLSQRGHLSQEVIAMRYGVSRSLVSAIKTGKAWAWL